MPVKPVPDGYHTVTPYLIVNDGNRALEFYKKAFGATEIMRMPGPNNTVGHAEIKKLVALQKELAAQLKIQKREFVAPTPDQKLAGEIAANISADLRDALDTQKHEKIESYELVDSLKEKLVSSYPEEPANVRSDAADIFDALKEKIFREDILDKRRRPDGRAFDQIRSIACEVGLLPRTHGSALFQRGETR